MNESYDMLFSYLLSIITNKMHLCSNHQMVAIYMITKILDIFSKSFTPTIYLESISTNMSPTFIFKINNKNSYRYLIQ